MFKLQRKKKPLFAEVVVVGWRDDEPSCTPDQAADEGVATGH